MKREMKLGLLFVVALALLCSSATSQAYNENWQEDAEDLVTNEQWVWDAGPSTQIWANFDDHLEMYWPSSYWSHAGIVQKWFTDARLCGYLNPGGGGGDATTLEGNERTLTGIFVHGNMYLGAGYMASIHQQGGGVYFQLTQCFDNGSWQYTPFNSGTPEETTVYIPDSYVNYDTPYWAVVTAEAWNWREGVPGDEYADDLFDMYVTGGLWYTEEDWLNEVEPLCYFEADDLDVGYARANRFSGIYGRGDSPNLVTYDMLDAYQLNEDLGFHTEVRGTGEPGLGDYNGDNTVDQADFTTWADSYGDTGTGLPADGNGDGVIDQADFTTWADNYGNVYSPTPQGTNAKYTGEYPGEDYGNPPAAVPEPATLMLLGLGGLAAIRRRK